MITGAKFGTSVAFTCVKIIAVAVIVVATIIVFIIEATIAIIAWSCPK